ncbi:hypothetical protein [Dyella solisilvae]|uniref:hypothetical protein n=1 Tax=Dyella solisilvae TaxID=1920168 RepID=UPI0011C0410C|nr:hypothetical protein [Dyella solisilvae]
MKSEALAAYQPGSDVGELKTCNIERLDSAVFQGQKIAVSSAKPVHFSGWIAAPQVASPRYVIRFEDKASSRFFEKAIVPSIDRPDVEADLGQKAAHAGFTVELDLKGLPAADYHVYLAVADGGSLSACDNGRMVAVGP